jgi:hypothetical protein
VLLVGCVGFDCYGHALQAFNETAVDLGKRTVSERCQSDCTWRLLTIALCPLSQTRLPPKFVLCVATRAVECLDGL